MGESRHGAPCSCAWARRQSSSELGTGGVTGCAVRGVEAFSGRAAQAVGDAGPFRRGQHDRLGGQCLAGQGREQGSGLRRGHRAELCGEALAYVADQVRLGPGGLGGLHRGNRFLDDAMRLRVSERCGVCLRWFWVAGGLGWRCGPGGAHDFGREGFEGACFAGAGLHCPLAHQRRQVKCAGVLSAPGGVVGPLAQGGQSTCVRGAPELRLILLRQARRERADALPPGREDIHQGLLNAGDLPPVAVLALHPPDAEPEGQRLLRSQGSDRGCGGAVPVQGHRVQCPPLAVGFTEHFVQDQVVHVQLRVAVAAGVLAESGDHPSHGRPPTGRPGDSPPGSARPRAAGNPGPPRCLP